MAFALVDEENNEFVWAATHDGDFAAAEADVLRVARAGRVARHPGTFIDVMHVAMVRVERL